jgi:hypothetical protein
MALAFQHVVLPVGGPVAPIAWQAGTYYSARRTAEPLNAPVIVQAVEEITGADRFVVDRLLFRRIRRQPA